MTDEMLAVANRNRDRAGISNATFLKGTIEKVPLPEASVDVVISNCVINLSEDKAAVIAEAFRVLKPGGVFAVADVVELDPTPIAVKAQVAAWTACVAGALPVDEYRALLIAAGFSEPEMQVHSTQALPGGGQIGSAHIRARKPTLD
jgi:ubiquinone/menaquinone biosynthesis C-methylase UbiE